MAWGPDPGYSDLRSAELATLYEPIADAVGAVRRIFDDELTGDQQVVNGLCDHVRHYRGKMLRPALVLLTGKACGRVTREHHVLGAVVELVHMATLVHDDVLDEADLRRRSPTINTLHGNEAAVLLGDYLISHAFHLCSSLETQYASRLIGSTTNTVCEGELMQVFNRGNYELDEETYLEIISRKTASLLATCCVLGAKYAGADAATIARMESFGMHAGLAFQIVDDILDLAGTEKQMGKTLGRDLDMEKLTLPLIHFLQTAPEAERAEALAVLNNGHQDRSGRVRGIAGAGDSIQYAYDKASHYVRAAVDSLADLPPSDAKDSLTAMAEFIVRRTI